jgi:phenylacetate-CoA ligase
LDSLYGRIFQSLALPLMLAPTRSCAHRLAQEIRRQQRWPIERIQQQQLEKIRTLVELARSESAFYKQLWKEKQLSALDLRTIDDLHKFPVTTKADLEAHFPDGLAIASRKNADWQYVGTRGTTRRVMVIHDFERRDAGRAAILVTLTEDSPYRYGTRELSIPPDACSVHCGLESNRAPSVTRQLYSLSTRRIAWNRESVSDLRGLVMDNWICKKTVLPPLPSESTDDQLRAIVKQICQQSPMQLVALPEYLRVLAKFILRTGQPAPQIPVIRPMGANFPASWKSEIEAAFGGNLREHYGSREMGPMAFDCSHACGLHLLMNQHCIEVVRDGRPVADGEIGKVIVTDLNNLSMPIVRYEIGDLARIDLSPCACGRTTPRIHLEGRVEDAFVTGEGRILSAEAVANFFAHEPQIADFQLTEQVGKWNLRIVPLPGVTLDELAVGERFLTWAGDSRPIMVRTTDSILPEASGKFRHCKSISYERIKA